MNVTPFVEYHTSQQTLLGRYVNWQLATALSLGIIVLVVGVWTHNQYLLIISITTLVSSATFRLAQHYLHRHDSRSSLVVICIALLMLVAASLIAAPLMLSVLTLLPILLVTVLLPFIPQNMLRRVAVLVWLIVVCCTALGIYGDQYLVFPEWRGFADRTVFFISVAGIMGLLLLLLSQFHLTLTEIVSQAIAAREQAEQKAWELQEQTDALQQAEQRLMDLVATLETPVVTVAEGVVLAPIIGRMDSRRAQALTNTLLQAVHTQQTYMVIIDLAGVSAVDMQVAHALLQTTRGLRLLGCQVVITGIAASVASTMTQLGIDLSGVTTARSPLEVLSQRHTSERKPHNGTIRLKRG